MPWNTSTVHGGWGGSPFSSGYVELGWSDPNIAKHEDQLLAYYALDAFTYDAIDDINVVTGIDSKGDNDLTNTGKVVSSETGKRNSASQFDGTDKKLVKTADLTDFQFGTNNFAISLWVNPSSVGQVFLSMQDGGNGAARPLEWSIQADGSIKAWMNNSGIACQSGASALAEGWNHLVLTRYGSDFKLWINGLNNGSVSNAAALQPANFFGFGQAWMNGPDSGVSVYTGMIDECAVWNGLTFTSDQDVEDFVTSLYNNGEGRFIV